MNINGTCPLHMNPRKLPINTTVETVLILKERILLIYNTTSSGQNAKLCNVPTRAGGSSVRASFLAYANVTMTNQAIVYTSAHSLLLLAGRRFLVFLFVISPPVHVGVGVICMICL